jgi:hypothetical protein
MELELSDLTYPIADMKNFQITYSIITTVKPSSYRESGLSLKSLMAQDLVILLICILYIKYSLIFKLHFC